MYRLGGISVKLNFEIFNLQERSEVTSYYMTCPIVIQGNVVPVVLGFASLMKS